jgi:RNA polymerase sigma-70 factor (ECF subfamily)
LIFRGSQKLSTASELENRLHACVRAARGGDNAAYATLLREVYPVMRRYAYAQMGRYGRQHMVEDIVQEALLSLHLKLHTYDDHMPFLTWMRAVTRHRLIDTLRKEKVPMVSLDAENIEEPADPHSPEEGMITKDLMGLLEQLKPPSGEIIYALKVEGASVRDLAQKFKLSESNIKILVHRGLKKLSDQIRTGS